ncbi:hypothetical protein ES703_10892 [subsurface metagenome]
MAKEEETPEAEENAGGAQTEQPASTEQPEAVPETPESKEINKDACMWAMICHLLGLAGIVIPFVGNIVAPLVVWQIKKDDYPFVDEQGKEAVNFQISMTIYGLISAVLTFICVGFFLLAAVVIVDLIFLLIAAVKANNGYHYRYPLTIRFIK